MLYAIVYIVVCALWIIILVLMFNKSKSQENSSHSVTYMYHISICMWTFLRYASLIYIFVLFNLVFFLFVADDNPDLSRIEVNITVKSDFTVKVLFLAHLAKG